MSRRSLSTVLALMALLACGGSEPAGYRSVRAVLDKLKTSGIACGQVQDTTAGVGKTTEGLKESAVCSVGGKSILIVMIFNSEGDRAARERESYLLCSYLAGPAWIVEESVALSVPGPDGVPQYDDITERSLSTVLGGTPRMGKGKGLSTPCREDLDK